MANNLATQTEKKSVLVSMATRYGMEAKAFEQTVRNTVMPAKVQVTNEQFAAFLLVANEYKLNPITKEIYAFPSKGGGVQPIVSIDGWLNIINSHPQFDGMEFIDSLEDGKLSAVTCRIFRKDRNHPTEVTEYMSECKGTSEPWRKWPVRMLRHKATIQAARYAFGFSGIADPDEADRMESVGVIEQAEPIREFMDDASFAKNLPTYTKMIESRKKTPGELIAFLSSKKELSPDQCETLNNIKVVNVTEAEVVNG